MLACGIFWILCVDMISVGLAGWFGLGEIGLEFGCVVLALGVLCAVPKVDMAYDEPESLILAQSERWRHA